MPGYLSPEWVQAFNAALGALDLGDIIEGAAAGSLTVSGGSFAVAQVVTGAPAGTVRTVLTVADGRATLAADPDESLPSDVTMALAYDDALAIAQGELDPADALAAGKVRVRGELAVLVAAQAMLNAVAAQLGTTLTTLTDIPG
jgi:putative sterol carrier protein